MSIFSTTLRQVQPLAQGFSEGRYVLLSLLAAAVALLVLVVVAVVVVVVSVRRRLLITSHHVELPASCLNRSLMNSKYRNWKSLLFFYCATLPELPTRAHACRVVCATHVLICMHKSQAVSLVLSANMAAHSIWRRWSPGKFTFTLLATIAYVCHSRQKAISNSHNSAKITLTL